MCAVPAFHAQLSQVRQRRQLLEQWCHVTLCPNQLQSRQGSEPADCGESSGCVPRPFLARRVHDELFQASERGEASHEGSRWRTLREAEGGKGGQALNG